MSSTSTDVADPLFPGEITDAIIDYLHNDHTALRTCALVCGAWLPASRHHLFEVFTAGPEKTGLTDLLDFLTSTPDVSSHIRHFVLKGYRGISLKNLVTLILAVPNVRVVELENLYISIPLRPDALLPSTIELSALRIASCNVTEEHFDRLFHLLNLFSVVHTLRMEQNSNRHFLHTETIGPRNVDAPKALQVSELSLACMSPTLISQLIRPTRMAHWETLRVLELDECIEHWSQVTEIGKLLFEVGPRLRRLALKPSHRLLPRNNNFNIPAMALPAGGLNALWNQMAPVHGGGNIEDTRSRWASLNLAKCTHLDEFMFDLAYGTHSPIYDIHAFFKLNVDILTTVAPTVRCIKPRIVPVYPFRGHGFNAADAVNGGPLQTMDWPLLDETLSDARFAHPRVVLDVTELKREFAKPAFDALKAFLTGCLYRIRRRGTLTFEVQQEQVWRGDVFFDRF